VVGTEGATPPEVLAFSLPARPKEAATWYRTMERRHASEHTSVVRIWK